jgi:SAM-dependent methyltransferase
MATKNFDFNPEYYDLQVDWDKRMEKEKHFFERIFIERDIKKVLEIGCGTGHHAQLFAGYATEVVAIDPDPDMIDFAGKNTIKAKNVTLYQKGFEEVDSLPPGDFDLITSLGNTLPILGDRKKIKMALKNIRKRLAGKGLAILQFLNFSSTIIEKNNYYPPKVFEKDGFTYIFIKHFQYGKKNTRVDFIITRLKDNKADDFFVNSTYLATLKVNMFKSMAVNAGFKKIKLIGAGGNEDFDPRKHISLYALLERS